MEKDAKGKMKEYQKKYYQENKERKSKYFKKRYIGNREQIIAKTTGYNKAHPEAHKAAMKRYEKNHPEKIAEKNRKRNATQSHKEYARDRHLKSKYGISLEEYHQLYDAQNGKCSICKEYYNKLAVDHNHKTGKVRGLLCIYCNTGLGYMKDNILILENAIQYIKEKDG